MNPTRTFTTLSVLAVLALMLSACGAPQAPAAPTKTSVPSTEPPTEARPTTVTTTQAPTERPETEKTVRLGLVSDVSGLDDHAWNALSWKGMEKAKEEYGVEIAFIESTDEASYVDNITQFVDEGVDIIVTVGNSMADATGEVADQNPDANFIIVGSAFDPPKPNVLGVTFANDSGAFLAGYLAAGMSQSGVVGKFGGMNLPPVNAYLIGFQNGVSYYNSSHEVVVELLGAAGRYINSFDSKDAARQVTEVFIAEGADVILPVAGPASHGAAEAILEHEGVLLIGTDFDWCVRFEEYCSVTLTSVSMPFEQGVFEAVGMALQDDFAGGEVTTVGQLPLHDFEDEVPEELLAELETVRANLVDGSLSTGY
jgi:basic membrane protein A